MTGWAQPQQCEAIDSWGRRCALPMGHVGDHAASVPAASVPAAPPPPAPAVGPSTPSTRSPVVRFLGRIAVVVAVIVVIGYFIERGSHSTPGAAAGNEPPAAASTPNAAAAFEPIQLSGQGAKVPKFSIPEGAPAMATFSYRGDDNFIVHSLASDGSKNDGLVNVIGDYDGTVLFDQNDGVHSVAFQIETTGPWTALVEPVSKAPIWGGSTAYNGRGDAVIHVSPSSSGLTTMTFGYQGDDNFIVHGYSSSGVVGLVNEIGDYSGDVLLPDGTFLITVEAEGAWSITPK
jgi:hypothetical protein